ncbi:MAG: BPTI/Kunitz domain-containing protein [Spirosomataceae bacterium]
MKTTRYRGLISWFTLLVTLSLACNTPCPLPPACQLAPEAGPCYALHKRYYYDKNEKRCKEFTWGGCEGVVPFETLEACKACECSR